MSGVVLRGPVSAITIQEENGFVTALSWRPEEDRGGRETRPHSWPHPLLNKAATQLEEYFRGRRRVFDLPLEPRGTDFQESVWRAIARIPYGETRSYGFLAQELGTAARAVGTAAAKNPLLIFIPCHRVVGKGGALGGYSGGGGIPTKRCLLRLEGHSAP
jgi:methylated-DNA-[protein]-cysteine S-methyltransferase